MAYTYIIKKKDMLLNIFILSNILYFVAVELLFFFDVITVRNLELLPRLLILIPMLTGLVFTVILTLGVFIGLIEGEHRSHD